ncbi:MULTISPECIES: hypothetical protein [Flavobacterium]|uniref:SMI1/KNR4 family protein n=1 Tax=Flavobacterium endoglycinae TaxID=2816357 RepID=A0ABX7QFX9_9FLAO|nr:hypothetical protein [Flavobacterium endoglycinae]QSW89378.1 hypothetical protein J0383_00860 [Flavobacterium endoglycinae]
MNILQKILGTIFPPYKFSVKRKEQKILFNAIINALPEDFSKDVSLIKTQTKNSTFFDFGKWDLFPEFQYVVMFYKNETYYKFKKRGNNFKISGLRIFSKLTNKFEEIEILIQDNLVSGLKIQNSHYHLNEFKLSSIDNTSFSISHFEFPPNDIDYFYDNLDNQLKEKLNYNELFDIDYNGRTFYVIYDLEDGNYIAVDKNHSVYSLVHDARPAIQKMNTTFLQILNEIETNQFNINDHLESRYRT